LEKNKKSINGTEVLHEQRPHVSTQTGFLFSIFVGEEIERVISILGMETGYMAILCAGVGRRIRRVRFFGWDG
jgi:hypothetical protein